MRWAEFRAAPRRLRATVPGLGNPRLCWARQGSGCGTERVRELLGPPRAPGAPNLLRPERGGEEFLERKRFGGDMHGRCGAPAGLFLGVFRRDILVLVAIWRLFS